MTGDEINEAIEAAVASSTDAAGNPATLATVYLRHIREVRRCIQSTSCRARLTTVHHWHEVIKEHEVTMF